ncbi:uroporphyrinogen-III synthase [Cellulosimicrobium sp. CUA-896]|uniref:uroporphyrinogen-III synthase n=1 Tax=Cellulosimicrobium sp. CUA-896 TaxID=1517881 RepID=UPI00096502C3|nr:uroporphyrinogen-III synthase [Cellulosimicrobium sp. CUA-896]OLT54557.1 hypothetical protein BJF88_08520 [Cellulosimicrobium sp. CUA-896]
MTPGPLRDPSRGPAPVLPAAPSGTSAGTSAAPADDTARAADAADEPLAGRTVLLPRAPERAAALAQELRAAGAEVLVSPAIERAPVEDTAPVDDALALLADGRFAWVVVTSVNAIDELAASAARRGTSLADVARAARWAAVGPATRRALERGRHGLPRAGGELRPRPGDRLYRPARNGRTRRERAAVGG